MKEDIIKMAQEAGFEDHSSSEMWGYRIASDKAIERFAALVAARCADIAYEAEPFHSADLIREAFGVKK